MKTISTCSAESQSAAPRVRQSNIELLRILAMFFVLVVHADFWGLGAPTAEEFGHTPWNAITRTVIESLSIVCVNVFILISGWFGIRFSKKGFLNYIFQCLYFLFGIYAVLLVTGHAELSLKGIAGCLCLTSANWFIRAYAALYILAPVLNCFIDHASRKQYRNTLLLFFVFQTIFGWSGAAKFVEFGYSTFSFIGLYLLARYVKIYGSNVLSNWGGHIYIVSVVLNSLGYYAVIRAGVFLDMYAYANPLVIAGALGLLVCFDKMRIGTRKGINWIAASAFAAFLLHSNPNIGEPVFKVLINKLYVAYDGLACLAVIFLTLVAVFACGVLLDQPRKWIWSQLCRHLIK